jgi:hypothetical protein
VANTAPAVERINPSPVGLGNGLDFIESSGMSLPIAMRALVYAFYCDEQSNTQNSGLSVWDHFFVEHYLRNRCASVMTFGSYGVVLIRCVRVLTIR